MYFIRVSIFFRITRNTISAKVNFAKKEKKKKKRKKIIQTFPLLFFYVKCLPRFLRFFIKKN